MLRFFPSKFTKCMNLTLNCTEQMTHFCSYFCCCRYVPSDSFFISNNYINCPLCEHNANYFHANAITFTTWRDYSNQHGIITNCCDEYCNNTIQANSIWDNQLDMFYREQKKSVNKQIYHYITQSVSMQPKRNLFVYFWRYFYMNWCKNWIDGMEDKNGQGRFQ